MLLIEIPIESKSKGDQKNLDLALQKLAKENGTFGIKFNPEKIKWIIKGKSEDHLEEIVSLLKSSTGLEIVVGSPQVAYRETITRNHVIDYTYKKQSGGSGQFARVIIEFAPLEKDAGYQFENKTNNSFMPQEFVPGVMRGVETSKGHGVLAGFPTTDFKATFLDGAYHDLDSSEAAFEIAAWTAFREGAPKARPVILEPIMKVEVITPEEFMGSVIGDLNIRRGQITGMSQRDNGQAIHAMVPLSTMFGYVNKLRDMTQSRATYTMEFAHYDQVPYNFDDDPTFRPALGMRA